MPVGTPEEAYSIHLGRSQLKVEYVEIFLQPLDLRCARDGDDVALLDEPAERDLDRRLAVRRADSTKHRVRSDPAEGDRAIRRGRQTMVAVRGEDLRLVEIGMVFDLVGY